jgi:hypothetical protein
MSLIDEVFIKAELYWFRQPAHYRWFVGCMAPAIVLGIAGGLLGH